MASPSSSAIEWEKRGMCGCKGCAVAYQYQRGWEDLARYILAIHVPSEPEYVPTTARLATGNTTYIFCTECDREYPCSTVKALDGKQK